MRLRGSIHEDFSRIDNGTKPSEANFGVSFSVVFALMAAYSLWRASLWALAWLTASAVSLLAAMLRPAMLEPLNNVWSSLSISLHNVLNPVVMLVLYVVSIVPVGAFMKLSKRDPMSRRFDRGVPTYWIDRNDPAESRSMRNQF